MSTLYERGREEAHMTIGELAGRVEISGYTLRYYEKKGLIRVARDGAGRRDYKESDVEWVRFIRRLKDTGMLLRDIKRYCDLRYQGDETLRERLELLMRHRPYVLAELEKWEGNLQSLDAKIEIYRDKMRTTVTGGSDV